MLTKSFYTGFLAIFMVFSTLLATLVYKVYQTEKVRPMIYNCFLYQGDYEQLKSRIEIESKYIDRFVIVQAVQNEKILEEERQLLLKDYPEKIIYVTTGAFSQGDSDQFFQDQYLKGLEGCGNQDIVLFSSAEDVVDFKMLYGSLDRISKHPKTIYALKNKDLNQSDLKVKATTYQKLKEDPSPSLESWTDLKVKNSKKRRFFFQTQHRT